MSDTYWRRGAFSEPTDVDIAIESMEARAERAGLPSIHPVVGIALGGCVEAVGTERKGAMRRKAHAHTSPHDAWRGWLCFLSSNPSRVLTSSGAPTRLLWHEWAHIHANAGHTERFRALLRAVGQPAAIK